MTAHPSPRADTARQLGACAAAVAQVALPVLLTPRFDADDQPPNLIQPSSATFVVWLPSFATSLGYAARPSQPPSED